MNETRRSGLIVGIVLVLASASWSLSQRDWWALPPRVDGLAFATDAALSVVVETLEEGAFAIGLSEARVRQRVLTRLSDAQVPLAPTPAAPYVYVNMIVLPNAAYVRLDVHRSTLIEVDGEMVPKTAIVWTNGTLITYAAATIDQGDRVIDALDGMLQELGADFGTANP